MVLIIGYGNTLRGDDGVGQHIVRRLEVKNYRETVDIMTVHQLTPELVEPISKAEVVIFVDATEEGDPGDFRCVRVVPEITEGAFTHNVSPASLLTAAFDLYGVRPQGILVTITGVKFDYGEEMSPQVEAVIPEVMAKITQLVHVEAVRNLLPLETVKYANHR
jgi:hydrogenase maturation protease